MGGDPSIGQTVGDAPGNFQWIEFEPARVNVAATLESPGPGTGPEPCNSPNSPSNTFSFADVLKNKQKGTVKLVVVVPGPGTLELAKTKKVKGADERAKCGGRGAAPDKPKGKATKKLNKKGKAKVTAEVTYTPDGGTPNTEDKKIKLVKR